MTSTSPECLDYTAWLAQVEAMKVGVSQLEPSSAVAQPGDGDDGEDDDVESGYGCSSGNDRDEIWDFLSDEEGEEIASDSGDLSDEADESASTADGYGPEWLATRCAELSCRKSGLGPEALQAQVVEMLSAGGGEDALQSSLADLVGFDELDFVMELLSHRSEVVAGLAAAERDGAEDGVADRRGRIRLLNKRQREEAVRRRDAEHKSAPLAAARSTEPEYPHVYRAYQAGHSLSDSGKKYALPAGTTRTEMENYEEYTIPAGKTGTLGRGQKLVQIAELDGLCRRTFAGYRSLNRMQSLVYPVAYGSSENMLICAPTGAGKTDAAMLTILHTLGQYCRPNPRLERAATEFAVAAGDFKVVYVAPMKALAAEITLKLGTRLAWLGIGCREFTGDMHLTKSEIVQTQIMVTTPEKWDVITRKGTGDTELVQKVRLLIIDEVHMLHDERGAVLESIVARTQRQVESTQSLIRIVGLSATLPNYVDVADFLRVNKRAGMFYFDASFRPVPLEQHFIGVKGKAGTRQSRDRLDQVTFDKVREMLEQDHQVMVFVHSRRDTQATAKMLYEKAVEQACADLLDASGHEKAEAAMRDVRSTRAREMRELIPKGVGIHHAGMARTDRNLMERLFADGVLKVLCCTATLAWGINLPAAAVIIKGTQVYSAQEGKYVHVGILDVLQIFGRAGRPQFEDVGIGMICTTHDKLAHYLSAVTEQVPIESRFSSKLVDNLNAEIALGTVTSIPEAVEWIGYSYLFVRMKKNPTAYGIEWSEMEEDASLVGRRRRLLTQAARTLQQSQMIVYEEKTEEVRSKEIGRIASQYYIQQSSIDIFNALLSPGAGEKEILQMIAMSAEFDQIQTRNEEMEELSMLRASADCVPVEMAGRIDRPQTKTNILLQSYISRVQPRGFGLANDQNYVAQQAGRICRALFMMALNRRWASQCLDLLRLAKSIEKRIWAWQHPLRQFDLPKPVLDRLDGKGAVSIEAMREMDAAEIGSLVRNARIGLKIATLLQRFPTVSVQADMAPLNRDVLRLKLRLTADFRWHDGLHGTCESYHVWVENSDTLEMYHHHFFLLSRRRVWDEHVVQVTIALSDPAPDQVYVRVVSDRWLGAETVTAVSFQHLIRPDTESVYTDLLNLQPLPVSALADAKLENLYTHRFTLFNPMQTQIFHTLYHTAANVLLGSPTGSGKTVAAELAVWWALRERPACKVVYIAPMKALVRERVRDWGSRLAEPLGLRLVELTGDRAADTGTIRDADMIITTPEKWDGISRGWQTTDYVRKVALVIMDEIHLLAGDRGPVLEMIVSRMNYMASSTGKPLRLLGMSTACANATDLANWLAVKEGGLFNFRHSVRPVPLQLYIDAFPARAGFCPLMQSMNRPTFLAIKKHSPEKPVIVFVPSRRQTRLTAKELIKLCGVDDRPRRFLHADDDELQLCLARIRDDGLREAVHFGIGLHHAGLVESDRHLAEELFLNGKIQVLVATSTLAWGVNLPAHLVVVKGTQYYDAKTEAYKDMDLTDVLQMLGRAGRPQFDSSAVARILTRDGSKDFYKHFLHTGFPVESSLHTVLDDHLCAELSTGTVRTRQDALDLLTWTFFFRRLYKNPSYYGLELPTGGGATSATATTATATAAHQAANDYMTNLIDRSLRQLAESGCVHLRPNGHLDPTPLGRIASRYYLSHRTVRQLARDARPDADPLAVLSSVCRAAEYDELPVRHNEHLLNADLSRALALVHPAEPPPGLPMSHPHLKAFLLLHAHLCRFALPVPDYVGDQTSVLDQAVRILHAAVDVLAERDMRAAAVAAVRLLQAVKTARWPAPAPAPAQAQAPPEPPRLAAALPDAHLQVGDVRNDRLTVTLRRRNRLPDPHARAYTPRFPKPLTEGWIVLVGHAAADDLLAVRRMSWAAAGGAGPAARRPHARALVHLPAADSHRRLDVLLMSDVYPGVEYRLEGVSVPGLPRPEDAGGGGDGKKALD